MLKAKKKTASNQRKLDLLFGKGGKGIWGEKVKRKKERKRNNEQRE